ncbi:exported hypothetical protein [Candidatus Xenohaliotis californiensis]|uniref:Tyrosine specific protein phosphatases domain-containing protein n=1 Tax=Candidatus Xenohaliotis californiensis TaxID=84677 RepID=A0ABM9N9C6_9RICK|nr:exported hypothetical protein [Candidatus Xenohaliotis californiensis]
MKLFVFYMLCFFIVYNANAFSKDSVYFVDKIGDNWLFRGDLPVYNNEFKYSDLYMVMHNEAMRVKNIDMPNNLFIVDINLLLSDSDNIKTEFAFFKKYPAIGEIFNWPIFGTPSVKKVKVFGKIVDNVVPNNGRLFGLLYDYENYYPQHVSLLINLMNRVYKSPRVFYIHCDVGCDRVSEIVGAYRMNNMNMSLLDSYNTTSVECSGMHYFSKSALEWYCYYMRNYSGKVGQCILD